MARIVVATNCNQLQPAETSLFAHCTRSSLTASTTHSHARSPSESTLARAEPGRRSPPDEAAAALGEERGRIVGGARVPRPAGPGRTTAGRGATALYAPRPPGLRHRARRPLARTLRAVGTRGDRPNRQRSALVTHDGC